MEAVSKNKKNGFYNITYGEEGVFLKVFPAEGGKEVELSDVMNRIEKKKIKDVDTEAVNMAVNNAASQPVKIAGPQEESLIDASASVLVSPDAMKGHIIIVPPEGGKDFDRAQIYELIDKAGIKYGVKKEAVEKLAENPQYNDMICIAEGTVPQNGEDAKIEFFFELKKEIKPSISKDGTVDYRELDLISNVKAGDRLCTKIPPKPGISGINVKGEVITAISGKDINLPKGKNSNISEDGLSLISAVDGQVEMVDGKVVVFSTYEVADDVDNSTGNIKFVGNVVIRGNVLSGFEVESGGNVEVWGVVEGARIKAGGDIILRRGMQGMDKGVLISEGDIVAKFIEHSNVQAAGDIKSEAVMHSRLKCGKRLELSGRKGLLVGGSYKVGKEIEAKVIGSPMATFTDIEVGVDPAIRERYKKVRDEIASSKSDMLKAAQIIKLLSKLNSQGLLPPDKKELYNKSVRTKSFYLEKINSLNEEKKELENRMSEDVEGKVRASNCIYQGTKVTIGSCVMYVKEKLQYCLLYRDGADVRILAYDQR